MTAVIVANGQMAAGEWLLPYLAAATVVVAADGGVKHLYRLARRPDVVVGDMDSLPEAERAWLDSSEPPLFLTYPADKDQTDLELALAYVLAQESGDILIAGALGGRVDHQLANILLLTRPELAGRPVRLVDGGTTLQLLGPGAHALPGAPGDLLTLLPVTTDVYVRQTQGLRWPLSEEWLRVGQGRGVSNLFSAENAALIIGAGRLLCIRLAGWRSGGQPAP